MDDDSETIVQGDVVRLIEKGIKQEWMTWKLAPDEAKTQFQVVIENHCGKCDICKSGCYIYCGGGCDNDKICCSNMACGAETIFPTSTKVENGEMNYKGKVTPYKPEESDDE